MLFNPASHVLLLLAWKRRDPGSLHQEGALLTSQVVEPSYEVTITSGARTHKVAVDVYTYLLKSICTNIAC